MRCSARAIKAEEEGSAFDQRVNYGRTSLLNNSGLTELSLLAASKCMVAKVMEWSQNSYAVRSVATITNLADDLVSDYGCEALVYSLYSIKSDINSMPDLLSRQVQKLEFASLR